jgi:RNA polymerase-interacting CarD/CdnL/TRCF family regulator
MSALHDPGSRPERPNLWLVQRKREPKNGTKTVAIDLRSLLKVGAAVRYRGLGTGQVVRHERREFQGASARFAVTFFPHRQLSVQVQIAEEAVRGKLTPVEAGVSIRRLLSGLKQNGRGLLRSWDERKQQGVGAENSELADG